MPLSFSFRKTTQGLNYFAQQAGGSINKMKALKLLYFADRYHLRKFGRPLTNDEYFAMPFGPVASGAKDLAENSDFRPQVEINYAEEFLAPVNRLEVVSLHEVDSKVFSDSDREALDFSWRTFGHLSEFDLSEVTHAYPEWKRHEPALQGGVNSRVKMSYEDFLTDPPEGYDPCYSLSDELREARREEIADLRTIHGLWN